nr:hypothetical protein [uncultured Sphingorhabdus sp.]
MPANKVRSSWNAPSAAVEGGTTLATSSLAAGEANDALFGKAAVGSLKIGVTGAEGGAAGTLAFEGTDVLARRVALFLGSGLEAVAAAGLRSAAACSAAAAFTESFAEGNVRTAGGGATTSATGACTTGDEASCATTTGASCAITALPLTKAASNAASAALLNKFDFTMRLLL